MPVKNIECQIAEMQIGRYVSGETLSDEALRQLEVHVGRCQSCSRILSDRKTALKSMLAQGYAAVTTDVPSAKKENLLINAIREKAAAVAPKEAPRPATAELAPGEPQKKDLRSLLIGIGKSENRLTKPLIYAAALGAVLLGMNFMSRGQESMFGGTADHAFNPASPKPAASSPGVPTAEVKAQVLPAVVSSPSAEVAKKPEPKTQNLPVSEAATPPLPDVEEPSPAPAKRRTHRPKPAAHHVAHRKPARSYAKPALHKRIRAASVKVYDESGNPIGR